MVENSRINVENDDDDDLELCEVFSSLANFSILATKKSEDANQCFLFGEISPNFDLKNMTSPYTKDISWKR
jgi:hypothetical protein